jgi:hypothetical protein
MTAPALSTSGLAPAALAPAASPVAARWRGASWRAALVGVTLLAAAGVLALVPDAPAVRTDADLARLMRAMAVVKALLVAIAAAGVWWRLDRPAVAWRLGAYLALPALAAAATAAMWRMVVPGTIAVLLHAAGLALVVVAWRDPDLFPARRR